MKVHVEFDVEVPDSATDEQLEEWLRFELKDNGTMQTANPLCHRTVEPILGTFGWDHVYEVKR